MDYYNTCPFPKPMNKKKKKACNGYKNKHKRYCMYCGKPYAERHELFGGRPNRQISIDNGFQVDLCPAHHRELQANITPFAIKENKRLKAQAQRQYMDKLKNCGMDEEDALGFWMSLIGRNYLEDVIPK